MFKLIEIEQGEAYSEKTLLTNFSERTVWQVYVERTLEDTEFNVLRGLYVVDKTGSFVDPPSHVWEQLNMRRSALCSQ